MLATHFTLSLDQVPTPDDLRMKSREYLLIKPCFFCNLEGHFKSDCTQFWDAVADAKHPRHQEALSGVKASRARLMNEAESRRKETIPITFTTKKVKTLPDEVVASNLEAESSSPLKVDYGLAARTALQNVKQDLATKEVEQWVRSKLESTDLRESFNILGKTTKVEDKEEPRKQGLKLNVISGRTFGMGELWLRFASEHRLSECGELEKV